jgi:hypothetical protein
MSLAEFFDLRKRVNVLKRIKVDGKWKLYPAVVEPSRKLKDRVRVHGRLETHLEGSYCIEWREDGKRRRLSIPQRHQVLERARLKSLELEGLPVPQQVLPPGGFLLDPFGAGRQGRFLWHRFMLQLSLRSWGPGFDIGIGVGLVGWFPWAQASLLFPWYHFRGD